MINCSHFSIHFLDYIYFLMSFVLTSTEGDCVEEQSDVIETVIDIPRLVTFPSIGDDDRISPIMQWEDDSTSTPPNFQYFDRGFAKGNCNGVDNLVESDHVIVVNRDREFEDEKQDVEIPYANDHLQAPTDYGAPGSHFKQLLPEQIRWFYKQENDKKLTPFIGFDSLRIELKYRELDQQDLRLYESSFNSLSDDDVKQLKTNEKIVVRGGLYEVNLKDRSCSSIFWAGDTSIISRGIWFYDGSWQPIEETHGNEIESEHLKLFESADDDERQPEVTKKNVTQALRHIQFPEYHVEWYGPLDVYLYSETKSSKIMRSVTERLGFQKSGYRLQRGYYAEATPEDKQPEITHIVFVIHGVGQKRDSQRIIRNCGSLRKCANWLKERYFPHLVDERSEFFPVEWRSSLKLDGDTLESITLHQVRGLREFLNYSAMDVLYYTSPIYRMELICGLQTELNRLYDLFCLRNPNFRRRDGKVSVVAHSLGCVIAYDVMTGWNPLSLYESYVASSIDLLVTRSDVSKEKMELLDKLNKSRREVYDLEQQLNALVDSKCSPNNLHFSIENFFCLGSPLGVFLALRGVRPQGIGTHEHILSKSLVKRLFNIYHPTDPVAYRLEPLILKHYSYIMPLYIHFYNNADKKSYEEMKPEPIPHEGSDKRPHSPLADELLDACGGSPSKSVGKGESRWSMVWSSLTLVRRKESATTIQLQDLKDPKDNEPEYEEPISPSTVSTISTSFAATAQITEHLNDLDSEDSEVQSKELTLASGTVSPLSNGARSPIPEPIELEYRLDYVLREGNLEISSLSTLTSHTSYWTSYDVAYFILSFLHPTTGAAHAGSVSASPTHSIKEK